MDDHVSHQTDDAPDEAMSEHYIESQTSLVERVLRTLKFGDAFAVLDSSGDIGTYDKAPEGLFYRDTRYLSGFELRIDGQRPMLLSSVIQDDNASLSVDLTNPDLYDGDAVVLPRGLIAIDRTKVLWESGCYERIGLRNYDDHPRRFRVSIRFAADFRDLFEARGAQRPKRGESRSTVVDKSGVELRYDGLDKISRFTSVTFDPPPRELDTGMAVFDVTLQANEKRAILATIVGSEGKAERGVAFGTAYVNVRRALRETTRDIATVESSNGAFNEFAQRSTADVYMLLSRTRSGLYPYAGIPWFSTVFGRDGIITAMMMLWLDPRIAQGVLRYLADTQATVIDPAADAQPGKILHERRHGEMAMLGEVPFRRYYGTVDATPLFVMLAGLYYERTGDKDTIMAIWPHITAALHWCDTYGDRDGDGFVEYQRETEAGLANQGWKDSQDSIFHADGSFAKGAIALCEVQAYVYAAKHMGAEMATALGHPHIATKLRIEAEALRAKFHAAFWCEEIGTYALALDGDKKPCRVRSSNAGHALFAGIAEPAVASRVADTLTNADAFSAWGIRTISNGEARYNPMSYHNGSVWPHDNALIAMGFGRYGLKDHAAKVFGGLFDAASYQDLRRLPELFCGFARRPKRGPTAYPVACSPQAWAAAAFFGFLSGSLGLEMRHTQNEIRFANPRLPSFLDDLVIRGLTLGASRMDVRLKRDGDDVTLSVLSRQGDAGLVLTK